MSKFEDEYARLNQAQKQAVDTIDGPMLVLAGPGTGKTQLLSARVANILAKTDTAAGNILCLTFTENGAQNMRERLRSFIGDAAYDVTISTYHSFGSDIIKTYSEYFQRLAVERADDVRMERPVDELTQIQIVEHLVSRLPFDSPLLGARYYIKNVVSTIGDLKENLITPDKLRELARENLQQIEEVQPVLDHIVNDVGGFSRKKVELAAQYNQLLEELGQHGGSLVAAAVVELQKAHTLSEEQNSTTPLTTWKNAWLHKDENNHFTLTEPARSEKMLALANVYEAYERELKTRAAYDFDDMILRAIDGLANNDELRYNLQERYQYVLLDEFQDTNPSQFELVKRIADHPVHEGRPNVMAVGDDDQAIFAFQGAQVGNMKDFLETFRDVLVINLTENYRSHADILHVAQNIAEQIDGRLHSQVGDINKALVASGSNLPKNAVITRREFSAEAGEYAWVAKQIAKLVAAGAGPSHIAVLSPKHAPLENLVPFLRNADIPLSYEKRENILQTDIVQNLRLCAQLLSALARGETAPANQYFPLVLSLPYWNIPARAIWEVNWQLGKRDETRPWAQIALESATLEPAVTFYLALSSTATTEPLEFTLDKLAGTTPVQNADQQLSSPLRTYYFAPERRGEDTLKYYEAISHLSVIRSRLRDHQAATDRQLTLEDFLDFFTMYEAADASLINSHPIAQAKSAVQLMTVYKAKGLEFDHVFILQATNEMWGKGNGGNNKLILPQNLTYIRYQNSTDDERLRLLFVALTRARQGLYITSYRTKDNGKATTPLKYLGERDGISTYLPAPVQTIISEEVPPDELAIDIETLWRAGQVSLPADFRELLAPQLAKYQMSPTHLNAFLDLEHGGPETFLTQTLLRFPQAPTASGEYGTAVHNTLEWYQNQLNASHHPNETAVLTQYDFELSRRYLTTQDREHARAKGHAALTKYLTARADMFARTAKAEVNFYSEGVVLDGARLSGKIDRLELDASSKTVRIVDYKTGAPLPGWNATTKAYKYKHQLYFYKLLIEGSNTWRGWHVAEARLEFVEPDKSGRLQPPLAIVFDEQAEAAIKQLIKTIWRHIQELNLPDVSSYSADLKGIKQFEQDLQKGNV